MTPFFSPGQVSVRKPLTLVPKCGACGLHKTCRSPKLFASTATPRPVLVVTDYPTDLEDREGRYQRGDEGRLVREAVRTAGVDPAAVAYAHALACRPPRGAVKDVNVTHCRPALLRTIKELDPCVVVPMGRLAVRSVIGHAWKEDVGDLGAWVGWRIPAQRPNVWVCPTWGPYEVVKEDRPVKTRLFMAHVAAALKKTRKPWKEVPDYKARVRVVTDPGEAARVLKQFRKAGRPVAFDYETNMLKPDSTAARVVCCSASDGDTTIAYPWVGAATAATCDLLKSGTPMIASNMKFEDRWTRARLGAEVKTWHWDTMVAAHALDNRQGITSVKFQAFVRLGQPDYDSHVKPYLQSRVPGGNEKNAVKDCPLDDLLLYCGLDSLLEHKVAMLQIREAERLAKAT